MRIYADNDWYQDTIEWDVKNPLYRSAFSNGYAYEVYYVARGEIWAGECERFGGGLASYASFATEAEAVAHCESWQRQVFEAKREVAQCGGSGYRRR